MPGRFVTLDVFTGDPLAGGSSHPAIYVYTCDGGGMVSRDELLP